MSGNFSGAAVGQSRTWSYIAENCRVDLLDCLHMLMLLKIQSLALDGSSQSRLHDLQYFASLIFFREDSPEIMKSHFDTFRLHFGLRSFQIRFTQKWWLKRLVHSQPSALRDVLWCLFVHEQHWTKSWTWGELSIRNSCTHSGKPTPPSEEPNRFQCRNAAANLTGWMRPVWNHRPKKSCRKQICFTVSTLMVPS